MVSFVVSILIAAAMIGVVVFVGRRRKRGTPLTWGEAFIAGVWVFAILLLIYGIIPHHWLAWADNELGWRPDVRGIPTGPIEEFKPFGKVIIADHKLWGSEQDIAVLGFLGQGRGRVQVNAQILRDIVAVIIYGIALVGNILMWLWWQKRETGEEKTTKPAPTKESAFGRPVVEGA